MLLVLTDVFFSLFVFKRFRISREKRLLHSSCLSVHPSACVSSAPTQRIFVKFDIGLLIKIWQNPNLVKIGQKYLAIYIGNLRTFVLLPATVTLFLSSIVGTH
jgi:hypothetical protein